MHTAASILATLDRYAAAYSFPMLDNGYVYLAATRLALFRSETDWAVTIEVFGFSPREGLPSTYVRTFGSRVVSQAHAQSDDAGRRPSSADADEAYHFVSPIDDGDWNDRDDECVVPGTSLTVRGRTERVPTPATLTALGIEREDPSELRVYELSRALAATLRDAVLTTPDERRREVPGDLHELLVLDDWHHPDLARGARPSDSATFRMLATVLESGDVGAYAPTEAPNTHWSFWPDGGRL
jgi:hypothetical protein